MNATALALLEKAAADNGFDRSLGPQDQWLAFSSTQAPLRVWLTADEVGRPIAALSMPNVASTLSGEGEPAGVALPAAAASARVLPSVPALHPFLRRAFQLSRTLPDELLHAFQKATAAMPRTTEAERLVVQRVGQDVFRAGLMDYWDGRCAITGLAVPELLRASHIKPWADCETDADRLDVFNGLLLAANLDTAFDSGLITLTSHGSMVLSSDLDGEARSLLGLDGPVTVRRLEPQHQPYMEWHRANVFRT